MRGVHGNWVFYEFPCLESEEFSWGLFVSWISHYCFQCGSHGKSLSLQFPMPRTSWENPTPVYPHDFSSKIRHGKVSLLPIPMKTLLEQVMGKPHFRDPPQKAAPRIPRCCLHIPYKQFRPPCHSRARSTYRSPKSSRTTVSRRKDPAPSPR